ncbi:MAG: bifunctional diaminohydroxyphosphoribosylaminopyrimidine deaminase/5-amino-6-(5-phosphoribosylamino)uracil reductase RibD, partial [Gammaproteobacteria bacterium]|nr:bifunctional diaminohydroxyphosphoribosylaminopyrimidine deaminase/5-amino-6-(5-phosphoribosylamino)uracil reductase RibD [Gammaproteobacteria bacterium]
MDAPDGLQYMHRALELARNGLYTTDPNPRVGCVLVAEDHIVGEGWTAPAGGPHAERMAIDRAGAAARGATVYVTLEPCNHTGRTGPCTDALIAADVARVVCAARDPNTAVAGGGIEALGQAGIPVEVGMLEDEARAINSGYWMRMERGRPLVRSKLAVSLDGRTALANGESQWITSPEARADVHRWRARSSAVMTGVGTILADDPSLDARPEDTDLDVVQPS